MTSDRFFAEPTLFSSIQVTESVLEGQLRTHAPAVFGGYEYFDFRPAIAGPAGVRHPDGALLRPGATEWWVVEVELHSHDILGHVRPQLEGLSDGIYGADAFAYLERHSGFDPHAYSELDLWNPRFLLIVDLATPALRSAAFDTGFELLEVTTFRSDAREWALGLSGYVPRDRFRLPAGVDVRARFELGIVVLEACAGTPLGRFAGDIVLGKQVISARATTDSRRLALPISREHWAEAVGEANVIRLTTAGEIVTAPDEPGAIGEERH